MTDVLLQTLVDVAHRDTWAFPVWYNGRVIDGINVDAPTKRQARPLARVEFEVRGYTSGGYRLGAAVKYGDDR